MKINRIRGSEPFPLIQLTHEIKPIGDPVEGRGASRRRRRSLSGRQHVVVAATRRDVGVGQTRSIGPGVRHRRSHSQAAGTRPS